MFAYIIRRLLFVPPTLFVIILINFAVVQVLPGGPVEQIVSQLTGEAVDATGRVSGNTGSETGNAGQVQAGAKTGGTVESKYRGAQGLPPEFIADLEDNSVSTNVLQDIDAGGEALKALVASADGLQCTSDTKRTTRHFANTLFNIHARWCF